MGDRSVSPSKEALEFFKMKILSTLSKSGKKRRKCGESISTFGKEVSMEETTFSADSNTSTWRGNSGTLGSFLRSSIRRSMKRYKPNNEGSRVRKMTKQVEDCKQQ